ncbi:hypothetical protein A0H81_00350 [Grifola frondosa]|uniref:Aspartic peptidase DDI1-type domain-containing protein n=1 Tax=Grifola frondosa TaxID=5627 RepID=A0A1C7MS44_GRIFR|nr:hypothetical protein A0H81_00350 [Grifola frondosa]
MRERILEWHSRNPNQLAKGQLTSNANPPAAQMLLEIAPTAANTTTASYQLATTDRIAALEREILALRRGKETFDGVEVPRRAPPRPPAANPNYRAPTPPPHVSITFHLRQFTSLQRNHPKSQPQLRLQSRQPHTQQSSESNPTCRKLCTCKSDAAASLCASSRCDLCTPSRSESGGPVQSTQGQRARVSHYGTGTRPEDRGRCLCTLNEVPDAYITPEELLSISPEVRAKYREAVHTEEHHSRITGAYIELAEEVESPEPSQIPPVSQLVVNGVLTRPGVLVIPDPYETYLRSLRPGEVPEVLTVAKESHALRSIKGLIDSKEEVESIIDPGSQIIAMSEEVCHSLGLIYDPSIRVNMQSANGEVDQSLGLVRNISFQVSDIVLYLQVHVIRQAAYDILLGRPFDVLTQSVVRNFANEDQTITIRCPNTLQTATVPTIPRGPPRFIRKSFPPDHHHYHDSQAVNFTENSRT